MWFHLTRFHVKRAMSTNTTAFISNQVPELHLSHSKPNSRRASRQLRLMSSTFPAKSAHGQQHKNRQFRPPSALNRHSHPHWPARWHYPDMCYSSPDTWHHKQQNTRERLTEIITPYNDWNQLSCMRAAICHHQQITRQTQHKHQTGHLNKHIYMYYNDKICNKIISNYEYNWSS